MSRAALWRQENNVKERERVAEECFQQVVEVGRSRHISSSSFLPIWGSDETFHLHTVLLRSIIHSSYFQKKCCQELHDWQSIVDEIYYEVKHLTPFQTSGSGASYTNHVSASAATHQASPSIAFCLLLRLCTIRITHQQLQNMLDHVDSPYIRAIGFLYLRYVGTPDRILSFISPYLYDQEELNEVLTIGRKNRDQSETTVLGEYIRRLFAARDYYGTPLPRFPNEREIQIHLIRAESINQRAQHHFNTPTHMDYFRSIAAKVVALYGDDENPIKWYAAVVDRICDRDEETGALYKHPRFVVTFMEYGNTETVMLGEIDLPDRNRSSSTSFETNSHDHTHWTRDKFHGSAVVGHERPAVTDDQLYNLVLRREQSQITTDHRNQYARKPPSTKTALSRGAAAVVGSMNRGGGFQQNKHDSHREYDRERRKNNDFNRNHRDNIETVIDDSNRRTSMPPEIVSDVSAAAAPERKRTPEELAAIAEKKQKLIAKYG
jgi:pre-mRNA-splicing factor 38B